jgi:hypothetical protein
MFRSAPQKYRDIGGRLHTLQVTAPRNQSLGTVLLTDAAVEETNIVYPTEQFITVSETTTLEAKLEFVIDIRNTPWWEVTVYSYPYK